MARPGRSVELVEAALSAGGRDVARAAAWRVLRTARSGAAPRAAAPPPLPEHGRRRSVARGLGRRLPVGGRVALRRRAASASRGPATAWTRLRHPLVPDEEPSPLTRVLAVADSGNGLSSELDLATWHFINPELTVHLHREAVGEWVCVDATTAISAGRRGARDDGAVRPRRPGRRRRAEPAGRAALTPVPRVTARQPACSQCQGSGMLPPGPAQAGCTQPKRGPFACIQRWASVPKRLDAAAEVERDAEAVAATCRGPRRVRLAGEDVDLRAYDR